MQPQPDFSIGQYDLQPPLELILRSVSGTPIDLSTAQAVYFHARHQVSNHVISGQAVIVQPTILAGLPTGRVDYVWVAGDTAQWGMYWWVCRIIWALGVKPQTVPNFYEKTLEIRKALAPVP